MEKKAPFILHTVSTGSDRLTRGGQDYGGQVDRARHVNLCQVRSVFVIYDGGDGQEGGLLLLDLMERVRVGLLQRQVLGPFQLDWTEGLQTTVYDNVEYELGAYHVGGMVSNWIMPPVKRMDVEFITQGERFPLPHLHPMWEGEKEGENNIGKEK
jgi:hypothetical protein